MKGKRKKLFKPVVVGFAAIYLVVMLLSTYLVKTKFVEGYEEALKAPLSDFQKEVYAKEQEMPDTWDGEERRIWYQALTNFYLFRLNEKYMRYSLAVYDEKGELLAKSENTIGDSRTPLDEILPRENKEFLAKCEAVNGERDRRLEPPRYEIQVREGRKPYEIYVRELTWEKKQDVKSEYHIAYAITPYTDYFGNPYYANVEDEDTYTTWCQTENKQIRSYQVAELDTDYPPSIQYGECILPYTNVSYESWEKWDKSEYLHDFPKNTDLSQWNYENLVKAGALGPFCNTTTIRLLPHSDSGRGRYIEVHMESCPWLAAIDYMKYLYGAGLVLMLACMIKILYSANRLYDQQEALEETRKDFINTMAHELKTPLGVIRNFAENLLEHNMEEKRDYYLEQIVGQTEEMDRLAGEMILISRMDSEKLVLQREHISLSVLIEEQLTRLKPLTEEKQIRVEVHDEQDFQVEGDPSYLSKAMWNLLVNAIDYNVPEGKIRITLREKACTIENTGSPLSEEQLKYGFDLFYSQNKSRSSQEEKHMGLGLYLAKKILDKHGLKITLENAGIGVRVTVFLS
ncbi:sensor histidine kinase [bacterium 1XD21-13]|nr:sensor histidine kinase [bacterium 1XD21-13]